MTNLGNAQNPILDTLAQLASQEEKLVLKKGTDVENKSTLLKRARAKFFTSAVVFKLCELDSPLKDNYWDTFHCCSTLVRQADQVTSKYCKNRWCMVCNRIRTAELINKYNPVLSTWDDRWFVTLTIPNIPATMLSPVLDLMQTEFTRIRKLMQYHKIPFIGLRKLECTYNPVTNEYHPHYHVIVRSEDVARNLLSQWLARFPSASEYAQDARAADKNDVVELFKYFTKIITTSREKEVIKRTQAIYISALDVIFQAVRGRRTFQSFGFKLPPVEDDTTDNDELIDTVHAEMTYRWFQELADWLETGTGELLTGYTPDERFKSFLSNSIR